MINSIRCTAILLFLALNLIACSEPQPINAFVKGSFAQIQQSYINSPHMIVFWGQNCAYCMKEFTFFENALSHTNTVKLITVATDPFLSTDIINQLHQDSNLDQVEQWVFSESVKEKLYFDVSKNWRGELPFIIFVNKDRRVTQHLGMLKEIELVQWIKQQDL